MPKLEIGVGKFFIDDRPLVINRYEIAPVDESFADPTITIRPLNEGSGFQASAVLSDWTDETLAPFATLQDFYDFAVGIIQFPVGEINTSSNLGTGVEIAAPKVGSDLPFKTLIEGPLVEITFDADEITIGVDPSLAALDEFVASALTTGVFTGGEVTTNGGDSTKYDVAAGTGVIVDWTTPATPIKTKVVWTQKLAVIPPDPTLSFTANGIDINGDLVHGGIALDESGLLITGKQARFIIELQSTVTADLVNVTGQTGTSRPGYEVVASILDWILKHPPLNEGNLFTFNNATTLTKGQGTTIGVFANRSVDPQDPVYKDNPADVGLAFVLDSYQDGIGGFNLLPSVPIVVDMIDDGSGTLQTMANNKYAVRRIVYFGTSGNTVLTYGQAEYGTLALAKEAIFPENPILDSRLNQGVFTTALVHKKNADLSDPSEAEFVAITGNNTAAGAATVLTFDVFLGNRGQANSTIGFTYVFHDSTNNNAQGSTAGTGSGISNGDLFPLGASDDRTVRNVNVVMAAAAVSGGTVGTPVVRLEFFTLQQSGRTSLGILDVPITNPGEVQTFNNLGGSGTNVVATIEGLSTIIPDGALWGANFINVSGSNNINAISRFFVTVIGTEL